MKTAAMIREMFSRIAPRYDLLNRLLSLGLDSRWRRRTCRLLDVPYGARILDLCAGTGKLALECQREMPDARIVACDFAAPMLQILRHGNGTGHGPGRIIPLCGEALSLPFAAETFDAVVNGFGARSFEDLRAGLRETSRVLRPGGQLIVLEFFRPRESPWRTLFETYFRHPMPWLGRVISRHEYAYTYLHESVAGFVSQQEFAAILDELAFQDVQWTDLAWGVVTILAARKAGT